MLATTAPELEFLNTVVEVNELSADALPAVLRTFTAMGAPMPTLSAAEDPGSRPAEPAERDLGYQPSISRPIAVLDLAGRRREQVDARALGGGADSG